MQEVLFRVRFGSMVSRGEFWLAWKRFEDRMGAAAPASKRSAQVTEDGAGKTKRRESSSGCSTDSTQKPGYEKTHSPEILRGKIRPDFTGCGDLRRRASGHRYSGQIDSDFLPSNVPEPAAVPADELACSDIRPFRPRYTFRGRLPWRSL
jgi:hypothetical protein